MTLSATAAIISALSNLIKAPAHLLPTFGWNEDGARPEIQVDTDGYHFIIIERGQEIQHTISSQLEQLLYEVFEGITFSMACEYELNNRAESQDHRIIMFAEQIRLLRQIDETFATRQQIKVDFYLRKLK